MDSVVVGEVSRANVVAVCVAAVEGLGEEFLQRDRHNEAHGQEGLLGAEDGEKEEGEMDVFHTISV